MLGGSSVHDELFCKALIGITDMGRASTSVLQRRFGITYATACQILDQMEREGLIEPAEAAKPRNLKQEAYVLREKLGRLLRVMDIREGAFL